jgi:predicted N-acetyltransferase YhbS
VLGEPSYYARFGFRRVKQPICPFDPSNEHFMALHYEDQEGFQIGYESEFTVRFAPDRDRPIDRGP